MLCGHLIQYGGINPVGLQFEPTPPEQEKGLVNYEGVPPPPHPLDTCTFMSPGFNVEDKIQNQIFVESNIVGYSTHVQNSAFINWNTYL